MIELLMDQKDLKQIREVVLKNNFMLIDLMDVKQNVLKNKILREIEEMMLKWKSEIVNSVDVLVKEIRDEREFR